ncbi:MAG: RNA 2',3'-cyclic phosphodiesterase [Candidatus Sericytochromatia bacterium]|nr:RNA 2',3'-cyclic phosphodiesterase [Candidatus Sericytochromatia bacterium]
MPPEPKRLFIAISLPPELRALARAAQKLLRECHPNLPCAWVLPEKMHLTLKFLGLQSDAQIVKLTEILPLALAERLAFQLQLDGFGCFPALEWARVVFWNVYPRPALMELQQALEQQLLQQGFAPAEHPYHPHLTLGRVRQPQAVPLHLPEPHLLAAVLPMPAWNWQVEQIELLESVPSPNGFVYNTLERFLLRA